MKNLKNWIIFGLGIAVVILLLLTLSKRDIKPSNEPTLTQVEQTIYNNLMTLHIDNMRLKKEISRLDTLLKIKESNIKNIQIKWQIASNNIKKLTLDEKMWFIASFFEDKKPIIKYLIDKDTLICFSQWQTSDIATIFNDYEYQALTIDSLFSFTDAQKMQIARQKDLIEVQDGQIKWNETLEAAKDDQIRALNQTIDDNSKAAKKAKRKAFWNGIGAGIATGAAGVLILILSL